MKPYEGKHETQMRWSSRFCPATFHKQRVKKVLSSDVNGGPLADEARGCMAFMCTRGAYALILGSRTRGQPVCLTMGDVMLGGTMGVVMLGCTWLAQ